MDDLKSVEYEHGEPVEGEEEASDGSYFVEEDEEEDYGFGSGSFDYSLAARAPLATASAPEHTAFLELDDFRSSWLASMTLGTKLLSSISAPKYLINFLSVRGVFQQVVQSSILSKRDLSNLCLVCSAFLQEAQKALFQSITLYSFDKFQKVNAVLLESPHLATLIQSVTLSLGDLHHFVSLYPTIAATLPDIYEEQDAQEEDYYYADNLGEEQRVGGMQRSVRGGKRWEHDLKKKIGKVVGKEEWEERRFRDCFTDTRKVKPILKDTRDTIVEFLRRQYSADPFVPLPPPSGQDTVEYDVNAIRDNRIDFLGPNIDFLETFRHSALRSTNSMTIQYPLSHFASYFFPAFKEQPLRSITINGREPEYHSDLLRSLKAKMNVENLLLNLRKDDKGLEGLGSSLTSLTLECAQLRYGREEVNESTPTWRLENCVLEDVSFPSSSSSDTEYDSDTHSASESANATVTATTPLPLPTLYAFLGDQSDHLVALSLQSIIGISLAEVWDTVRAHSTTLQVLNLGDIGTAGLRRGSRAVRRDSSFVAETRLADAERQNWQSDYNEDADFPERLKANDAQRGKVGPRIGHSAYELELVSMKQPRHVSDKASTSLSHCHQLRELVLVDHQTSPTFPISIIDSLLSSRPPKLSKLDLRLGIDPSITSFEYKEYKGKVRDVLRWNLRTCDISLRVGCDSEMEGFVRERLEAQERRRGANRMAHQRAVRMTVPALLDA